MGKTIAVLFGGPSNEHEISCLSAKTVMIALRDAGYLVYPVAVDRDLNWRHVPSAISELAAISDRLPSTADLTGEQISTITADLAFPVLHGVWGEDGGVQQRLTELKLPYVGSGVAASKLAMDKAATKSVLFEIGVQVVPAVLVTKSNWESQLPQISQLGEDLFIKPCHGGSSLGVTHLKSLEQLPDALQQVFALSDDAIVEIAVSRPREIEIGVLQQPDGKLVMSVCGEIKLRPEFDFYDYQAKYLADGAELIVPAQLSDQTYRAISEAAQNAFTALGCAGLARVDFLVTADDLIYLNEVNTMPGFTQISMYPKMFAASGIELPELVDALVQHGLAASR
jgi:D-alanine-D-alanine ligase